MPLLAQLLLSLFTGLVSFFVRYLSKKLAFGMAAVAVFGTLTLGLFALMRSVIAEMTASMGLVGLVGQMFGCAIPPVAPACFSAYLTVWAACKLYKWQVTALSIVVKS